MPNPFQHGLFTKTSKSRRKEKHSEAIYRRRQLQQDPIAFRQKHALEQAATKQTNLGNNLIEPRAKHAIGRAASRSNLIDPI